MGKTYNRSMDDFHELAMRSASRRQARELSELAWGTAIADQDYRSAAISPAPARSMGMAQRQAKRFSPSTSR